MSATRSVIWGRLGPVRRIWLAAEDAIAAITRSGDLVSVDRATTMVMADSRAGRMVASVLDGVEHAWPRSMPGRVWHSIGLALESTVARVQAVASVVVIAMGTALVLRMAAPSPAPLSWIVPAAVGVAALVGLAVARPLAATLTRRPS